VPTHVEITLDKPRKIRYNVNAMCDLEEIFGGQGLASIFDEGKAGFTQLRALLYVGLKHGGDKKITIEDTGSLIDNHVLIPQKPLEDVFEYVKQAMDKGGFGGGKPKDESSEGNAPAQAEEKAK